MAIETRTWRPRPTLPGGVQVALADGSGRFVSNNISATVWRSLGTMNGNETGQGDY